MTPLEHQAREILARHMNNPWHRKKALSGGKLSYTTITSNNALAAIKEALLTVAQCHLDAIDPKTSFHESDESSDALNKYASAPPQPRATEESEGG